MLATVLFTDVVDSTRRAAVMGDVGWRDLLERHDMASERLLEPFRGKIVKRTGGGLVATFDGPGRAIHCGVALRDGMRAFGLELRAGLHAGEILIREDDIGGLGVHVAARIQALASPGEVLASSTVRDLVAGSGIPFDDRGAHALKGLPEPWRLYAVDG